MNIKGFVSCVNLQTLEINYRNLRKPNVLFSIWTYRGEIVLFVCKIPSFIEISMCPKDWLKGRGKEGRLPHLFNRFFLNFKKLNFNNS